MKLLKLFSGTTGTTGTTGQRLTGVSSVVPSETKSYKSYPKTQSHTSCSTCMTSKNTSHTAQPIENTSVYDLYDLYDQKKQGGKVFDVTLPILEYAVTLLVNCPASGKRVHLWVCSRCPRGTTCTACTTKQALLDEWRRFDFPHSFGITEGLFEVEPNNPLYPMVEACPNFYKGCFTCRYCNFSKAAFCSKYNLAGQVLS